MGKSNEFELVLENTVRDEKAVVKGFKSGDQFMIATVVKTKTGVVKGENEGFYFPFKLGHKYTQTNFYDHAVTYDCKMWTIEGDVKDYIYDPSASSASF